MIDTIWIGYKQELTPSQLQEFYETKTVHPKLDYSTLNYSMTFPLPDNRNVKVVYHPFRKKDLYDPLLIYQFSIPHFVYGTNVLEVVDLQEMIEKSNELLSNLWFLPPIDISKGFLHRIDLVCNYQVGDLLPFYKKAFAMLHYPHRKTIPQEGGSLYPSTIDSCSFYDKELEQKSKGETEYNIKLARGIWRHERRLHNARQIEEVMGTEHPTILDFTQERIVELLMEDLERLNVKDQFICGEDIARDKLTNKWGAPDADNLIGFMLRNQGMDRKEVMANYKLGPTAIRRRFNKIYAAGVSLILKDNEIELPPLTVEYGRQKTQSPRGVESRSDTIGLSEPPVDVVTIKSETNEEETDLAATNQTNEVANTVMANQDGVSSPEADDWRLMSDDEFDDLEKMVGEIDPDEVNDDRQMLEDYLGL